MVLIRNNVQKESTYGWYPSQVNVYENPRAKKGYGEYSVYGIGIKFTPMLTCTLSNCYCRNNIIGEGLV